VAFQITRDESLLDVVNRTLSAVGFPNVTDAVGSNDPAVQQMVQSVNQAGTDLLGMHDWQQMLTTFSTTIQATEQPPESSIFVDLPEDFFAFKDQSQWNVSQQLPMIGPVLSQDWQRVTVRTADFVTRLLWRIKGNKWEIKSPPAEEQTITMEYISQGWVKDADDSGLYKNIATKNGDIMLLDNYLTYYLAKAKWLEVKGFDSAAAMRDFNVAFGQRFTIDQGAPVLSLINRTGYRYLDYWNIPDTNYGV
jgi:hypothetical protein